MDPECKSSTHIRGTKRIDTILVSEKLSIEVTNTKIHPFGEIIDSDHKEMSISIRTRELGMEPVLQKKGI